MSALDNFVEEMLQPAVPKRALLEKLLGGLDRAKPPQFKIPAPKYTFESNLHGLIYDYQNKTVTVCYKVAHSVYPDVVVSFATFRALLEGLAVCIRQQKW